VDRAHDAVGRAQQRVESGLVGVDVAQHRARLGQRRRRGVERARKVRLGRAQRHAGAVDERPQVAADRGSEGRQQLVELGRRREARRGEDVAAQDRRAARRPEREGDVAVVEGDRAAPADCHRRPARERPGLLADLQAQAHRVPALDRLHRHDAADLAPGHADRLAGDDVRRVRDRDRHPVPRAPARREEHDGEDDGRERDER